MRNLSTEELTSISLEAKTATHQNNLSQEKEEYWRLYEHGQAELLKHFDTFTKCFTQQVMSSAKEGKIRVEIEVIDVRSFEFKHLNHWKFTLLLKCLDFALNQNLLATTCEIWHYSTDDVDDASPKALGIRVWGW